MICFIFLKMFGGLTFEVIFDMGPGNQAGFRQMKMVRWASGMDSGHSLEARQMNTGTRANISQNL